MDRSFLSHKKVVEVSRKFVCIRLSTYEDKDEAEFLKKTFTPRSGELENTTFVILSSDGQKQLVRANRGPFQFRNGNQLARKMESIAKSNTGKKSINQSSEGSPVLPWMKSVDLALNVASADQLPLVIVVAKDRKRLKPLQEMVRNQFNKDQFLGQFVYASTQKFDDLKPIVGQQMEEGIYLIEPGEYGVSGKKIELIAVDASDDELHNSMERTMNKLERKPKDHRQHVQSGIRLGIEWESEIPETDPQAIKARERFRGK